MDIINFFVNLLSDPRDVYKRQVVALAVELHGGGAEEDLAAALLDFLGQRCDDDLLRRAGRLGTLCLLYTSFSLGFGSFCCFRILRLHLHR